MPLCSAPHGGLLFVLLIKNQIVWLSFRSFQTVFVLTALMMCDLFHSSMTFWRASACACACASASASACVIIIIIIIFLFYYYVARLKWLCNSALPDPEQIRADVATPMYTPRADRLRYQRSPYSPAALPLHH